MQCKSYTHLYVTIYWLANIDQIREGIQAFS